MSFTTEVKQEVGQNILKPCCQKAELAALIQLCSSLGMNNNGMYLTVRIENASTAKRIWKLIRDQYDVKMELSVIRKMNLKKNNIYVIRATGDVRHILDDLTLLKDGMIRNHPMATLVRKDCCARAYLAGAFMASGSVNSPNKTNYHLEIATLNEKHAEYVQKLMERFLLPAKVIKRRNQFVVYLKASEKIADFLKLIGAYESLMKFEDVRIQRDYINSLTRLDNCEFANEVKTLKAGQKQLESIELLERHHRLRHLDSKLQEAARLRRENPEASLLELCELYEKETGNAISKSGMKHRLARLSELAEDLKEDGEE